MLKIYNTLTKQKEEFVPLNPPLVRMYMCGPTVYDYFHIGNARSFIMSDIVRRYLEYKGYFVTFVMNLTDVDDKIIKKANQEGKPAREVAEFYIKEFFSDIEKLKIKPATYYPRATEFISDMIDMIKKLEEKGIAYNVDGNVFYDVSKFQGYGKLSGKNIDELEIGARVEVNEEKKHPLDFALWKKAKEGEPYWESPWGKGRPGWHIECSAMSCKLLGESFDIHAGGHDLIFPHHENEIAQSEAANEKPFAKYWLHFGFLNINEEKMSKSLGNFFTAREVLKKYSAEAIRLFFAQTHYRGPLNFSDDLLQAAEKGVEKLQNLADKVQDELQKNSDQTNQTEFDFKNWFEKFEQAMDDDFNSAQAIAVMFDFTREINRVVAENENLNKDFYNNVKSFLKKTAEDVLGVISFEKKENLPSLEDDLIELLIKIRNEAKKEKNYSLSDKIRNELKKLGIILQDNKDGTSYKKSSK
ncbi:MAG: cysteine--tRNA ligase [Ignavibacterium sp.]|uniref:cysteine--tRNA ligase n=1 Tax=Ignavibacterium sp. TaxID=2651167 RepID=UPI00404A9566